MKVEALLQAAANRQLGDFMAAHAAEITPQLGEQAREVAVAALSSGNLDLAEIATGAAANVWLKLGNYQMAIKNMIDMQQVGYMRADRPDEYAEARTQLLDSATRARQVGAQAEAFKAATIAADCSYWAAETSSGEPDVQALRLQTLRDVIAAAQFLTEGLRLTELRADAERFVSLTAAAAQRAMSVYFWPQARADEADGLLRQLAKIVDQVVPADFAFSQMDAAGKIGQTAQTFATLSDRYGE